MGVLWAISGVAYVVLVCAGWRRPNPLVNYYDDARGHDCIVVGG